MDKQAIKNNATDKNQWIRILYMVLFSVILYLVMVILWIVVVVQAVLTLIMGKPNNDILNFSASLVRYLREIADFLTYNDDTRPYPFQAWQVTESEGEIIEAEFETPVSDEAETPESKTDL